MSRATVILAFVGLGCCASVEKTKTVVCATPSGSAMVAGPSKYRFPKTVPVTFAASCLDTEGRCSGNAAVGFNTDLLNAFGFGIDLLLGRQGAGSYDLALSKVGSFPSAFVWILLGDSGEDPRTDLQIVSGTLMIDSSTASDVRVSFDIEALLPATNESFSITNGAGAVTGCHVVETSACIHEAS